MQAFVVSDNDEISNEVREILLRSGHDCPDSHSVPLAQGVRAVEAGDLIVVVMSPNPERAMEVLREMSQMAKQSDNPKTLFAVGPADATLILRAIQEVNQYIDENNIAPGLEAELGKVMVAAPVREEPGYVIAVLAPSGGSGSSMLSANLATVLAKENQTCALFDLKLGAGVLDAMMNLKPTANLAQMCREQGEIDRAVFDRMVERHASGVSLLSAPTSFNDINSVTAQGVHKAITTARGIFPYVIVDADRTFNEEQVEALAAADTILLVIRLDFTSLRNARQTLEYSETLGIGRNRFQLVFNRQGLPAEVRPQQAAEVLGFKKFKVIPEDARTVNRAINIGVPVVLDSPRATVSRSIIDMARDLNNGKPE